MWRVLVWLPLSVVVTYAVLVAALLFLAHGGETPYVWQPPATPVVDAQGQGSFQVRVTPDVSAIDTPVSITVNGLEAGVSTLLIMPTKDARGVEFESWARY